MHGLATSDHDSNRRTILNLHPRRRHGTLEHQISRAAVVMTQISGACATQDWKALVLIMVVRVRYGVGDDGSAWPVAGPPWLEGSSQRCKRDHLEL